MPTQYKGRTFLTESETYERLGFSIDDVPQLQSARVFFYRGMADLKPGIPDEEKNVFVEGYFFADMNENWWENLAPQSANSEGVTDGSIARESWPPGVMAAFTRGLQRGLQRSIARVGKAFPCCAVVDGDLIEDKVYSDAESRYHFFVSIHQIINGPIYYPEDLVVTVMAELGIPPATHTQDAADKPILPRERATLHRIIGAMLAELTSSVDPATKAPAKPRYKTQADLIAELVDLHPHKEGISRATLENVFAAAKRTLESD